MVSKFAKLAPHVLSGPTGPLGTVKIRPTTGPQQPSALLQKGYNVIQFTPFGNTLHLLTL